MVQTVDQPIPKLKVIGGPRGGTDLKLKEKSIQSLSKITNQESNKHLIMTTPR